MSKDMGVTPSGSGSRASHGAAKASPPKASIPNAVRWPSGYADAFISFTPGQESALAAYDAALQSRDDNVIRETRYHLNAWDRHYGRPCTIEQRDRRDAALRRWGAYIYENGGGI